MNLKAVLRLMRKRNLLSAVRRRRPFSHYQCAVHKYLNLLNRQFDQAKSNQFWVADITCIPIGGKIRYLCAVLDLCGKVVLSWKIGADMSSSLVTNAIRKALKRKKVTDGLALHSGHGAQYTSQAYFDLTQAYHVSPSMSRPGCSYDNAVMGNFFDILEREYLYCTITLFAARTCANATGIEIVAPAVADARKNAAMFKIFCKWANCDAQMISGARGRYPR